MTRVKSVVSSFLSIVGVAIILCGIVSQIATPAYADTGLSQAEQRALSNYPNWVPDYGQCSATSTIQTIPAGTLATFIPEPYNGAFTVSANAHKVSPALLAALFSEEHNLGGSELTPNVKIPNLALAWTNFVKNHSDPNSGWAVSGAGAQGPFQFMPATFTGFGYDISQINNLLVSADAAAKYAEHDNATIDQPEANWVSFLGSYNSPVWYGKAVLQYYDAYVAQPGASVQGPPTTLIIPGCGQSASVDCSLPNTATTGLSQIRQTVVCLAQGELALWKSQPDYLSKYPAFIYAQTGFLKYSNGAYEEWCADFVSWIYKQAGYSFDFNSNWQVGYVPNIQQMGKNNNKFHLHIVGDGYSPRPGDLAIYDVGHVNMLVAVNGSATTYIGGDQTGVGQPEHTYGTQKPPSGSVVSAINGNGGITAYVSPD